MSSCGGFVGIEIDTMLGGGHPISSSARHPRAIGSLPGYAEHASGGGWLSC
jgi:hypothetical protein